ncbi:carbamoyltransferase [Paucibacter sp. DJ2R-2]|uniref:carbamoyltransferase family protein n=1 Tax=Paucibacter sp. DJ2R-2 TaxID=2893558 RepID=UPI0021E387D3|nr:carbamoyltransferase [Paucibacter sp. DJ2R-2]MCV2423111.1 carbamoyltransferase [Paucibacter sp. DJ4R-1]MCV2441006.1 carbamoyltransferase [Paucibacter sp. DJ2R-2]
MKILGLSAFYHDSAAALIIDGEIVAAAQEERFTRRKHDAAFPSHAIKYCLETAGIGLDDVDHIAFYDKPLLKFERLLETYLAFAPRGFKSFSQAIPIWLREKLFLGDLLRKELQPLGTRKISADRVLFIEHHLSHAASAFYASPFEEAAVLTIDGVGEWATTTLAHGRGRDLQVIREIHFPHSVGLLYAAFTYYLGFKVNSGEYKLMGLAPYGEPKFAALIRQHLIDIKADGTFRLDMQYFDYCTGLTMTNNRFDALFGGPPRAAESPLTQHHMDLAASIQQVIEEVVVKLARSVAETTGLKNLCLAGGVALNCVANGKILRDGAFDGLWVQPAAGDAGGSLGAALAGYHFYKGQPRLQPADGVDHMKGALLGPSYSLHECEERLRAAGARFTVLDDDAILDACAQALAEGKAVGWFQGRMEFGPRALGGRSILGDPRSPAMQSALNLKIKYRESFRPFAPSVLCERAKDWFELEHESPYMLLVADVAPSRLRDLASTEAGLTGLDKLQANRSQIPAVTHVDNSARVQTVDAGTSPRYHALISRFEALTGCPVLVNTSFNVRGEPLVCTPEDAFRCFMGTELDVLFVENCVLMRDDQSPALRVRYSGDLAPD